MSISALASGASTTSASTTAPSTCAARAASAPASGPLPAAPAFAAARASARSVSIASGRRSGSVRAAAALTRSRSSLWRSSLTASGPVTASIRRTFDALEPSDTILNTPISAVERTWVPPQSSREYDPSPISTIRTTSPYFSPNSAIAPSRWASSSVVVNGRTGSLRRIHSLTLSSTSRRSSSLSRWVCEKSKRSLSGPT
jgi:hypothetical protein